MSSIIYYKILLEKSLKYLFNFLATCAFTVIYKLRIYVNVVTYIELSENH